MDRCEGVERVIVEFKIADGVDGKNDFTAIISDLKFSKQDAQPPGYDPDKGVPPDEQTPVPPENTAGDPVDIVVGAYLYNKELIQFQEWGSRLPSRFTITPPGNGSGPLGRKWTHSYDWFIENPRRMQ